MSLTSSQIGQLTKALEAADNTYPKPVTKALEAADKLRTTAQAIAPVHADQLAEAIAHALLADRDPFTDPEVQRLAAARTVIGEGHGLAYMANRYADQHVTAAITEHRDEILDRLRTGFTAHADHLADAHGTLGGLDLDDHATIVRLGDRAAAAWVNAREATSALRTIDSGWVALANLTRFANPNIPITIRIADTSLEQYEQLGNRPTPWDVLRIRAHLDLATANTIHERLARHTSEREHRNANRETFADVYKRRYGIGQVITTT